MNTNKTNVTEFPHPYVTVDVLIFSIIEGKLSILLTKRSREPFAGMFAIPGGFVQLEETLEQAAQRVIKEKGHQENLYLEQLYTFGDIDRDPRGRVVSITYIALFPQDKTRKVEDKNHVVEWFSIDKLPSLAFDHKEIIKSAISRLQAKIGYSNLAMGLLPKKFRLTQLQEVYEIILGKLIDKRNFRKKMLSLDLLESTGEKVTSNQHRPAMLYQFKAKGLVFFN